MTLDQALAKVATELDAMIDQARVRFERSIVDNYVPSTDIETLCACHVETMQAWRAQTLADIRADLLVPAGWRSVTR